MIMITSSIETALKAETRADALRRDPDLASFAGGDWRSFARSRVERGVARAPRVAAAPQHPTAPKPTVSKPQPSQAEQIAHLEVVLQRLDPAALAQQQALDRAFGFAEAPTVAHSFDGVVQSFGGKAQPRAAATLPRAERDRLPKKQADELSIAMGLSEVEHAPVDTSADSNIQTFGATRRRAVTR